MSGGQAENDGDGVVLLVEPEDAGRLDATHGHPAIQEDDIGRLLAQGHRRLGPVAHVLASEALLPQLRGDESTDLLVALDDENVGAMAEEQVAGRACGKGERRFCLNKL